MIRRLIPLLAALALMAGAPSAKAQVDLFSRDSFAGYLDLRLALADGERSWIDGGFGKLRYGGNRDGDFKAHAQVADAALIWKPRLNWAWSGLVDVEAQPEQRPSPDLVQAFLQYKPLPKGRFRYSARAGLYWPEISLEHSGPAWAVTETITPSAINSWVGEEVKVVGIEGHLEGKFAEHTVGVTGGVFTGDDTSATLLSFRGWALHDIKSTNYDHFPLPPLSPYMRTKQAPDTRSRYELDDRHGYYLRVEWRPPAPFSLNAFWYDNEGDRVSVINKQWSWDTRFVNVGATARLSDKLHLSSQVMHGRTWMGFPSATGLWVDMSFSSAYLLATRSLGEDSVSGRIEWFETDDHSTPQDNANEDGWAATAAYRHKVNDYVSVMVEGTHVGSDRPGRLHGRTPTGGYLDPTQKQSQLQASLRLTF